MFKLRWLEESAAQYSSLETTPHLKAKLKKVQHTLGLLTTNPRHPGLNTHKYAGIEHPYSPKLPVFEAYVENQTPGAYRVFWCYGPGLREITIMSIAPHP